MYSLYRDLYKCPTGTFTSEDVRFWILGPNFHHLYVSIRGILSICGQDPVRKIASSTLSTIQTT